MQSAFVKKKKRSNNNDLDYDNNNDYIFYSYSSNNTYHGNDRNDVIVLKSKKGGLRSSKGFRTFLSF